MKDPINCQNRLVSHALAITKLHTCDIHLISRYLFSQFSSRGNQNKKRVINLNRPIIHLAINVHQSLHRSSSPSLSFAVSRSSLSLSGSLRRLRAVLLGGECLLMIIFVFFFCFFLILSSFVV